MAIITNKREMSQIDLKDSRGSRKGTQFLGIDIGKHIIPPATAGAVQRYRGRGRGNRGYRGYRGRSYGNGHQRGMNRGNQGNYIGRGRGNYYTSHYNNYTHNNHRRGRGRSRCLLYTSPSPRD